MTRDRREWDHPNRDDADRQREAERQRHQRGDQERGGERAYEAFGGMDIADRMQGPRERGGWQGGPYQTGGFQGGGGYAPQRDEQGFDIDAGGSYRGGRGYRGRGPERGGYQGAEGYRGDRGADSGGPARPGGYGDPRYREVRGGERGERGQGDRDWGAVARERAGFLAAGEDFDVLGGGERGDVERGAYPDDRGATWGSYGASHRAGGQPTGRSVREMGRGEQRGGEPGGGRGMRAPSSNPRSFGGGQDHPSWGRGWGTQEQTGWRGPGEMPGYRTARSTRPHFDQSSSGGQTAGEFRNWGTTGPHAGRGPRNYRRADDRILGELCDRLTADPEVDASDIEVRVEEGKVSLSGTVPDRWMKHRAEDVAESLLGVADVDNQLRVRRGQAGDRGTHAAESGPSGHNTVLHAEVPELLGAPTTTNADDRAESEQPSTRKGRDERRGDNPDDEQGPAQH